MRTLVITEHPEFGKVRTVEAGGRVWFCARDVASALGYANPKDAVNRHCRPKGVCVHDLLTAGGRQKVKFIDEGNLYRLMACSRLPSAWRDHYCCLQTRSYPPMEYRRVCTLPRSPLPC